MSTKRKRKETRKYDVTFQLNVIEFHCFVRSTNKTEAMADVMFNINLRGLDRIKGIRAFEFSPEDEDV